MDSYGYDSTIFIFSLHNNVGNGIKRYEQKKGLNIYTIIFIEKDSENGFYYCGCSNYEDYLFGIDCIESGVDVIQNIDKFLKIFIQQTS